MARARKADADEASASRAGETPTSQCYGGITGTGDVEGPATSTDNAIARYDGASGKAIQNSTATLDDAGRIVATDLSLTNDLAITHGGTGASSADAAVFNLISGATPTAPALSTKIGTLDAALLAGGSAELQEVWNLLESLSDMPALITPSDDHVVIGRDNVSHRMLVEHFLGESVTPLVEITTPADDDLFLVDDVSETPDEGKKLTWANLKAAIAATVRDVQVFTPANDGAGAWIKPSWATATTPMTIIAQAAGGGAGGGGIDIGTSRRRGGTGGAGGARTIVHSVAGDWDATEDVAVGLGGTGGAGATGDGGTAGSDGTAGGNSTFGDDLDVFSGGGGAGTGGTVGGTSARVGGSGGGTGTAGASGTTAVIAGGNPGASTTTNISKVGGTGGCGAVASGGNANQAAEYGGGGAGGCTGTPDAIEGGCSLYGGAGGGCGGGVSATPSLGQPAAGGLGGGYNTTGRGGGGAAGVSDNNQANCTAGTAGADGNAQHGGSGGGGGGSGGISDGEHGFDGGDGGDYGGGGGGGGAGTSANPGGTGHGGNGGAGGDGVVIVITG